MAVHEDHRNNKMCVFHLIIVNLEYIHDIYANYLWKVYDSHLLDCDEQK